MKTFKVTFTKTFTSGLLKGVTVTDKLSYTSFGAAENWVNTVRRSVEKGLTNFTLDYVLIQEPGVGNLLAWTRWDK